MDDELKQFLQSMEARLSSEQAAMESRLTEQMRDMQTEILTAFLPFEQEVGVRQPTMETRITGVEARMATLAGRLAEIEKKLLLNPPAA